MKNPSRPPITEPTPEKMIRRGILKIPRGARSIILFAHGPGKSCLSPRNRLVAQSLVRRNFAVMLPDLADPDERNSEPSMPRDPEYVERIATRLATLIDWLGGRKSTCHLCIGIFGVRTGAAAAMIAAARRPEKVLTVITRSGQLDLCEKILSQVLAPTLMIFGGRDAAHIGPCRQACGKMSRKPMLELVQGASHLFTEPGMIEKVASMSCLWFRHQLAICS